VSRSAKALTGLIRLYQQARAGRPSPCRFFPTCSAYAMEAVEVHGAVHGSALAVRRLCRCHPWGAHGIDLVPERRLPSSPDHKVL
jgi:putative membrane protein insertion efficiency factor